MSWMKKKQVFKISSLKQLKALYGHTEDKPSETTSEVLSTYHDAVVKPNEVLITKPGFAPKGIAKNGK